MCLKYFLRKLRKKNFDETNKGKKHKTKTTYRTKQSDQEFFVFNKIGWSISHANLASCKTHQHNLLTNFKLVLVKYSVLTCIFKGIKKVDEPW